jgi:hypothetical protein
VKGSAKRFIAFAVMTLLVFLATNLPFLMGGVSTGPNVDSSLGVTGWLSVHRGSHGVSVELVHIALLFVEIALAGLLTWLLSKALRAVRRRA